MRSFIERTVAVLLGLAASAEATHLAGRTTYEAPRAGEAIRVDGVADESAWSKAPWRDIDQQWLGPDYEPEDFTGRYKVLWSPAGLHLLVEVVDDVLYDAHRDPLVRYWDDDCLEIFIDPDFSGGDHQYNHNAWAYHVSLDNQAIDIGTDRVARAYNHHVESRWRQSEGKLVWELTIAIYGDDYVDDSDANEPQVLAAGVVLGLMLAYCDNDGSEIRELFIGSEAVQTGATDRGWIDAGIFGQLVLVE